MDKLEEIKKILELQTLKFSDFQNSELIGKPVLIADSRIRNIRKVNKTTFSVEDNMEDSRRSTLYLLRDGREEGASIWSGETAILINESQEKLIKVLFGKLNKISNIKNLIKSNLESLTLEQLLKIENIIKDVRK